MTENPKFQFLDLAKTTAPLRDELVDAVTRVVDSGRYIGGPECERFEETMCLICGTKHCIGVSNGLDALRLIFRAYIELGRLKQGDKVIVPANTYIASVLAVTDNGLEPVFIEPDAATLNLDWTKIEKNIDERTKAVLTVHLYGRISWDSEIAARLKNRGILIVEDNAQAIGAMTTSGLMSGALGDAAAFSFYPTKNIGALGDAGAVTTDDNRLADMVRTLANYGSSRRYHNVVEGYNCRLDPIQAAILNVKLKHLEAESDRRRKIAEIYLTNIINPLVKLPLSGGTEMVWHQFVVQVEDRDRFTKYLDNNGIGWDIHYPTPPHLQPCYSRYATLELPITESLSKSVVSLPVATVSENEARTIAEIINNYALPKHINTTQPHTNQ